MGELYTHTHTHIHISPYQWQYTESYHLGAISSFDTGQEEEERKKRNILRLQIQLWKHWMHCTFRHHTDTSNLLFDCYSSILWSTRLWQHAGRWVPMFLRTYCLPLHRSRARLKRDGTHAEIRFGLTGKWTSPFKLAGESVWSTTGSRGVRISGSNAEYTMFWGRVKDYWLPTPLASFPFTSPPMRHRVPSGFNWALLAYQATWSHNTDNHNINTHCHTNLKPSAPEVSNFFPGVLLHKTE